MAGWRFSISALTAMVLLGAVSCGGDATPGASPTPTPAGRPSVTGSPSSTPAAVIELRTDGLGDASFGDPVEDVLPGLADLGDPIDDLRMHGDMPGGYGGMDSTVRRLEWSGLVVVFHDWEGYYRDDGVMHLVAWVATQPTASDGVLLQTPEGIAVGSSVDDLRDAFGTELVTPSSGCWGPPRNFSVGLEPFAQLRGGLSGPAEDPNTLVTMLNAGAPKEGVTVC